MRPPADETDDTTLTDQRNNLLYKGEVTGGGIP